MRFAGTLTVLGLALALVAGLLPSAWAQISTGGIYGKVTDEQSAVLPGATITLTGANTGARTTTSGAGGEFRFIGLDPGTYTVSVGLAGFATTQRTVIVSAGVSVDVTFTAKVAGVAETVTVDAETPVIDSKRMGTGTTVSHEELTMIPNSRDPWAFMRAVPGVQVDRVNQAGSESGQQSGFIGKGSPSTDAMWVLDGIVITDPAAVGSSPTYFDFDAFDEVAITTGGADVRVATGGVGINLVTKRGTNAFHGGVSGFYAYDGLEASNLPAELEGDPRLQGNDKADHAEQLGEYGFELGGPILKDRLWFWGSYGKQDLRIQRLNQARDKTVLEDYNAKLNFQVSASNMLSASVDRALVQAASEVVVLADHTKLGTDTMFQTVPTDLITRLVTDEPPVQEGRAVAEFQALADQGIQVAVAGPGPVTEAPGGGAGGVAGGAGPRHEVPLPGQRRNHPPAGGGSAPQLRAAGAPVPDLRRR